ncbi:hypothetical protein diail_5933 [Diaporthe ilicicola]|nr:hypothetical protein diail_5933 [Diaporthe ilicicola]
MAQATRSQSPSATSVDNQSSDGLLSSDETSSEDNDSDNSSTESSNTPEYDPDQSLYGRWPRRLLHVDKEHQTLTSHEWEPGNLYGGWKEPKYNAISYTWGRFQLKQNERPEVQAVDIGCVNWAIPRIDPDKHFSVAEFLSTIIAACSAPDFNDRGNVEFIWLDVACIDQEDYRIKMLEVGRQAVIFQHAEATCVWLASSTLGRLERLASELWEASYLAPPADHPKDATTTAELEQWLQNWLEKTLYNVNYIIKEEPWFTSLWTLQEAFLRPLAIVIARDGCPVPLIREGWDTSYVTLRNIAWTITNIRTVCQRCLAVGCHERERIQLLLTRIRESGLSEIQQPNPFQLLKAASFRQVYDELDRVYGIMQIFGFKLGASKPKARTKGLDLQTFRLLRRRLKLSDLETELSQNILKAYPVQSQLSLLTSIPEPGQAWRLSPTSENPYISRMSSRYLFVDRGPHGTTDGRRAQESLCQLSTTQDLSLGRRHLGHFQRGISVMRNIYHSPVTWCHFSGKTCPLATLHPIWSWLNTPGVRYVRPFTYTSQHVALDLQMDPQTSELTVPSIPEIPLVGFEIQNWKQDDVIAQLNDRFRAPEPLVLCLGTQRHQTEYMYMGRTFYGLILVRKRWRGIEYWRRIGIVSWEAFDFPKGMDTEDKLILRVKSERWTLMEGIYG